MKRALITAVIATLALSSLAGSPVLAQGWDQNRDAPQHQPQDRDRPGPRDDGGPDRRGPDQRDRNDHRNERQWRAGDRLPPDYRAKRHVIAKPAMYHLHRPPRGHQWVRVGPDAVLVVIGTGVVIELSPGLFR